MPLSFFTRIVSLLLALVTIKGNLTVCITVLKYPFKSLKTPFTFLLHLLHSVSLKPCCSYCGSLRSHQLSFTVSCQVQHKSSDCHSGFNLDRFLLATVDLLQDWLFEVRLCVCQYGCGSHFAHFSFTYVRTLRAMRTQVSQWDAMRQGSQSEDNRARLRAASVEKNITQAFMVMLGFFLCCYIPSCIIIYITNLCSSCNCTSIHVFRDLQFIFVLSSSVLNPFVYAWRLPNFRRAFKKILRSRKIHETATSSSRQDNQEHTPRTLEFS